MASVNFNPENVARSPEPQALPADDLLIPVIERLAVPIIHQPPSSPASLCRMEESPSHSSLSSRDSPVSMRESPSVPQLPPSPIGFDIEEQIYLPIIFQGIEEVDRLPSHDQSGEDTFTQETLAKIFDTKDGCDSDFGPGSGDNNKAIKGVRTLEFFNLAAVQEGNEITADTMTLFRNNSYMVILEKDEWNRTKSLICKKNEDGQLLYYDKIEKQFLPLNNEVIANLDFSKDAFVVNLDPKADLYSKYNNFIPHPGQQVTTGRTTNRWGKFYHEVQEVNDGTCGIRSMNNFFGQPVVNESEYARVVFDLREPIEPNVKFREDSSPLKGADPGAVKAYIELLASQGRIDPKYKKMKELSLVETQPLFFDGVRETLTQIRKDNLRKLESQPSVDRLILETPGHFLVLRKNEKGRWHVIDSKDGESQKETFASIEDFLTKNHYSNLTVMYAEEDIPLSEGIPEVFDL